MKLTPETFLLGILGDFWWLLFSCLIDMAFALSDFFFTSESSSCPSISNAFRLDVALCPNHHADWNYQSAPFCSDLRNVAKTLLGKSFVSPPFVILQLLPENVFYIFYISLNWKDDNVISLPPMTCLVLITFRCPTIDISLMTFIKGSFDGSSLWV